MLLFVDASSISTIFMKLELVLEYIQKENEICEPCRMN